MNIRQPWVDHYEWTDSISDWAEHHALETERKIVLTADVSKADRHEGVLYTAPQWRVDQEWPVRRCSPEMAVWCPDDDPPREALSPAEAMLLCAIYCVSAIFVVWLLVVVSMVWSN